jgi:glutamate racemase
MKKLGILDYGIGGMDLYCRLKAINANLPITYFSDTGAIPYGKLDEDTLTLRLQRVVDWLKDEGVDQLVIACHSASTVAHRLTGLPIIDMIAATKNTLEAAQTVEELGIIGGGRTIDSGIYRTYAETLGLHVTAHSTQIFSIAIENDWTDQLKFKEHVRAALKPLGAVDALLLACTHYPIIRAHLSTYYDHKVKILNPIDQLIAQYFPKLDQEVYVQGADMIYTTGDVQLMQRLARRLYGLERLAIYRIIM